MARLVATKLGVQVELIPVTSANLKPHLQTGEADRLISTLGENPERAKVNDITRAAKASGEIDTMAKNWLGRPAGQLPESSSSWPHCINFYNFSLKS